MPEPLRDQFPTLLPTLPAGNGRPNRIILTEEDLETLDERFKELRQKIEPGNYVIEAKQTNGGSAYPGTTLLSVLIKPSEPRNPDASIKSMAFRFRHEIAG